MKSQTERLLDQAKDETLVNAIIQLTHAVASTTDRAKLVRLRGERDLIKEEVLKRMRSDK